jgi:hypothetical protein
MSKVKPSTKEQLIFYLIGHISLGTYDRRFLVNLESMHLIKHRPLTTNQADLLNKIIHRYSRQLARHEISANEAIALPWTNPPIESLPQFTETHLILVDDELILRSPYKGAFIKDFKKLEIQAKWEHDDRFWRIPASTHTLKEVKTCIEKHYSTVNYSEELQAMFAELQPLANAKCWTPTYKYVNGNFYITPINQHILDAIENIPFDIELSTLSRLMAVGIEIDLTAKTKFKEKFTDNEIDFASSFTSKIDLDDPILGDMILALKPDIVLFSDYLAGAKMYLNSVKNYLSNKKIHVSNVSYSKIADVEKYNFAVLVESGTTLKQQSLPYVSKSIQVVNSKPINLNR